MINSINVTSKSDIIGILASTLCFLHCIAAPFLFVAHAGAALTHELQPWWWGTLDIIFLIISLAAVYWSAKNTSRKWIKISFWSLWVILSIIVLNEKLALIHFYEESIYVPSLGLVLLHLYNHQYCRCTVDGCCAD